MCARVCARVRVHVCVRVVCSVVKQADCHAREEGARKLRREPRRGEGALCAEEGAEEAPMRPRRLHGCLELGGGEVGPPPVKEDEA